MKKAAYYARVSTLAQEEKGTIDSQKSELIRQIRVDGNLLVKEYIDNGVSGARLDRPALDELRRDLKENVFDVIYFHDTDRIARDVTYQNIIIGELIKYKKEIIIKGINYVNNPENKFSMTVLGAVSELEKAKIVERYSRGRRERARKGAIVDNAKPYGYNHIPRTKTSDGYYEINEDQAEVIRFIFNTYAKTDISLNGLARMLEEREIKTSTGKKYWKTPTLRGMLKNATYYGIHYFNRTERLESLRGYQKYRKQIKTAVKLRERSEWIEISVPAIINKELYDQVQAKLAHNKSTLRSSSRKYLLSGLLKCGVCNHLYTGVNWKGTTYYKCNHRDKRYGHIQKDEILDCKNKAVQSEQVEKAIYTTLSKILVKPELIRKYVKILNIKKKEGLSDMQRTMSRLKEKIEGQELKKQRVLDLYAESRLTKEEYIQKIEEISRKSLEFETEAQKIERSIRQIESKVEVTKSIEEYAKVIKDRLNTLQDDKKSFIVGRCVDEVVIHKTNDQSKVLVMGHIPLNTQEQCIDLPKHCTGGC